MLLTCTVQHVFDANIVSILSSWSLLLHSKYCMMKS
jgi:hypothetical protein